MIVIVCLSSGSTIILDFSLTISLINRDPPPVIHIS